MRIAVPLVIFRWPAIVVGYFCAASVAQKREKDTGCSKTGKPWDRPPSIQGSCGLSVSRGASGALPSHRATGYSSPWDLGGSSRRIIAFHSRAPRLRSVCSWGCPGPLIPAPPLPRSTRGLATGCNWVLCSESSGVAWGSSAGILGAPCLRSSIGSAAYWDLLGSRL